MKSVWVEYMLLTPVDFSYVWPAVPVAWFSWHYIRSRYLSFWSKVHTPLLPPLQKPSLTEPSSV